MKFNNLPGRDRHSVSNERQVNREKRSYDLMPINR